MNKTSLGIITLFIFLTLATIGGIKSEMDNSGPYLDISSLSFPAQFSEGERHRQVSEDREEVKEAKVSWYERCFGTCYTANGDWFDPEKLTTACHRQLLGRYFRVSYRGNSVVVFCNDTGNFIRLGRVLDLSRGAFRKLAPLSKGVITARIEVI